MTTRHVKKMRAMMERSAVSLTDEDALQAIELFPLWQPDKSYSAEERLRYSEKLYRVVQAHTSQADWTPDITPALYAEVAKPGEIPVWKQPTGAHDAYNTGDKVYYPTKDDDIYESLIDANVYSPEAYPAGWSKLP